MGNSLDWVGDLAFLCSSDPSLLSQVSNLISMPVTALPSKCVQVI